MERKKLKKNSRLIFNNIKFVKKKKIILFKLEFFFWQRKKRGKLIHKQMSTMVGFNSQTPYVPIEVEMQKKN